MLKTLMVLAVHQCIFPVGQQVGERVGQSPKIRRTMEENGALDDTGIAGMEENEGMKRGGRGLGRDGDGGGGDGKTGRAVRRDGRVSG